MKNDILIYFILIFFLLIKNKSFEKFSSDTDISELNKNIKNSFPKIGNLNMASLPHGTILPFADKKENIPEGWKECDGTNGTPNLKGRFLFGKGYSTGNKHNKPMNYYSRKYDDELNNSVDGNSVTQTKYDHVKLLEANLPKHKHTGNTNNDGSHSHGNVKIMNGKNGLAGFTTNDDWYHNETSGQQTGTQTHSHEFTTDETGGGESFEVMPPWFAIIYIIKLY
tara:strand:- start:20 stop:691 length:672 start_codon:yes stop_codon:yes gene_type:complete